MVGFWQLLIILLIIVLLFGTSRIEKLGPSLGKAIRGFKKGLNGENDEESSDSKANKISEKSSDKTNGTSS